MYRKDAAVPAIRDPIRREHTIIMQGDRDGVKPEHAVEMMCLIPNSQLAVFPNGDHFIPDTRPDKVVDALMIFLDAPAAGHR